MKVRWREHLLFVALMSAAAGPAFGQLEPAVGQPALAATKVMDQFPIYRVRGVTISCCLNRQRRDRFRS